ncbi:9059_t:CDS:2 [Funneliformis geosporum]|nr:9059_t:CDS:2 [Funneliformis geosporum]
MRRCPQLKYLDMISLKHQLFYFPEAKICLESLGELICETATDDSYFYGLASICQNIQRLVILNTRLEGDT